MFCDCGLRWMAVYCWLVLYQLISHHQCHPIVGIPVVCDVGLDLMGFRTILHMQGVFVVGLPMAAAYRLKEREKEIYIYIWSSVKVYDQWVQVRDASSDLVSWCFSVVVDLMVFATGTQSYSRLTSCFPCNIVYAVSNSARLPASSTCHMATFVSVTQTKLPHLLDPRRCRSGKGADGTSSLG